MCLYLLKSRRNPFTTLIYLSENYGYSAKNLYLAIEDWSMEFVEWMHLYSAHTCITCYFMAVNTIIIILLSVCEGASCAPNPQKKKFPRASNTTLKNPFTKQLP